MDHRVWVLLGGLLVAGAPFELAAACLPSREPATVEGIVRRIEDQEIRYVFVGERHDVGAVKRFAVDLANTLSGRGHDVGLYVEGFSSGCEPGHVACSRLARLFGAEPFAMLARESRAVVHALDPSERDRRAARMATVVAAGREALRVVLAGSSHVTSAWDPDAEHWVYGGGMRYPDPGDLAEAFPRAESLTVTLEVGEARGAPYLLRADGCVADYRVVAPY